MKSQNHILTIGQSINNYKIVFFLKKGNYAETYRVTDSDGKTKIMKLYSYSKLNRTQFDKNEDVLEIEILKLVEHPNILKYCDNGELINNGQKYAFAILDFISGETLADKMKRENLINPYEAKDIILSVLNGLKYLHSLNNPIIHNDISNLNIMLDMSEKVVVPKIIDFGYARFISQSNKDFMKEGLNPFYQANESFNKVFSVQSDIFSVGALYYHLLEGLPPWFFEISKYNSDSQNLEDTLIENRKKPLKFTSVSNKETHHIIIKALESSAENRFTSVKDFIKAMNGELEMQQHYSSNEEFINKPKKTKNGLGFSAIAGMQDLKETIQLDVINALNDKEQYAKYGLTIPNGILLYGPPGCGKTFFAERFAEEVGFNFYKLNPSDIQSKWLNASQENIKNLFDDARKNAPSVIFIDELDAVVPNRDDSNINHMNTSSVNEFLAQMNNCGEDNVFVIGATNRPNSIDPAILRSGRLDKTIFIPPPDLKARELMFKLYLDNRPRDIGLNYCELAELTENYVSSDIKFLCDEASRKALKLNSRISNFILHKTIKSNKPSLSIKEIEKYDSIREKMEGIDSNTNNRPRIGFKKD